MAAAPPFPAPPPPPPYESRLTAQLNYERGRDLSGPVRVKQEELCKDKQELARLEEEVCVGG